MFAFDLCTQLKGYAHPDYLLPRLTARQFLEWFIYAKQVGKLGVDRDDIHFGIVAAAMNGGRPTDFMPYRDPFAEDITAEELIGKIGGALPASDQ